MVPIIATVATAITSSSALLSSSSGDVRREPDKPITAAAPQIPVPPATIIASRGSTPSVRAIVYVTTMVSVTTTAASGKHLMPWVNSTCKLSLKPSRIIPRRSSLLEINPAASFTPARRTSLVFTYQRRMGNCAIMPSSRAIISAPNRLNPGYCLSHEPINDAIRAITAVNNISIVAIRAHQRVQNSLICFIQSRIISSVKYDISAVIIEFQLPKTS